MKEITISTDASKLDKEMIYNFLSNSYWSNNLTKEKLLTCINHSVNFGLYKNKKQIGYARVLTDYVKLATLFDVFILEEFRGKNYSKKLLEYIFLYPSFQEINRWELATKDAHGLYEKFGFRPFTNTENKMVKL